MKIFSQLLTILIVIFFPLSCENMESIFVDCNSCYNDKPLETIISISITNNEENRTVPITVYQGSIDDGEIIFEDINLTIFNVEVGKYYSVVAKYNKDGKTIYAVDGKKVRTKLDESSCSDPCYIIIGDKFDVRLK